MAIGNSLDLRDATMKEILGDRPFSILKPYGVAYRNGKIYITDVLLHNIIVVDMDSKAIDVLDSEAEFAQPIAVSLDNDGKMFVADSQRMKVLIYDNEGAKFGEYGDNFQLRPIGLALSKNKVYVSNALFHRIDVLDKDTGKITLTFGSRGTEDGEFNFPGCLATDDQGNVYVTDMLNFRIQKFDENGKFLASFGSIGSKLGSFARPRGVAVDRAGRLYVVDAAFGKIQVLSQNGEVLMHFGGSGQSDMYLPAGIAISYDGIDRFRKYIAEDFEAEYLVFVVSQFGPRKIYVYAFGQKR